MIIKKMHANFGCLENAEMELHEGLNIIEAPNESGKSTWCAFIRCMLYGIDSSRREKAGVKPDKSRYAPWNGSPMAGEMDIAHEGRDITLSRGSSRASAPFKDFSAVYTGTATPVSGLDSAGAGEALTGMPESVFSSSVFVRQSGLSVSAGGELEKHINSIASTGDEDSCAWSEADETLRKWLRRARRDSAAAEADKAALEEKLSSADGIAARRGELEAELAACVERCEALSERCARERALDGEARLGSLSAAREAVDAARERRDVAAQCHSDICAAVSPSLDGLDPDTAERDLSAELEELSRRQGRLIPQWIGLAVLALGVALCLFARNFSNPDLLFIPGVIIVCCAIVPAFIYRLRLKTYEGWCAMLLTKYGSDDPVVLAASMEAWKTQLHAKDASAAELAAAEAALDGAEEALAAAESRAVSGSAESPAAAELAQWQQRAEALRREIAALEGRAEAMGDTSELDSALQDSAARLEALSAEQEALAMAMTVLSEANEELEQRYAPRLGHRAAEILSRLTGGRYDALSFDRSLSASAKRSGDMLPREGSFLSAGAADQVYLALRLALCELALPEKNSCPLILDDALVNFDSERMALAMDLIEEIARERQVIMFSCHSREADYINSKKGA